MKILIGTPATGEMVTTTYCETLFWLFEHYRSKHPEIRLEHKFLSLALLPYMRNYFASRVLNDKSFTHLLFIDADMGFAPTLIEQMVALNKPVVGCIYPRRQLDLAQFYALRERIADFQAARMVAQTYVGAGTSIDFGEKTKVGDPLRLDKLSTEGGAIKVHHWGTGVMLIQRGVFEKMKGAYPALWSADIEGNYSRLGLTGGVLQCFESMTDEHGIYVGEDISFCRRWTEGCGGEIWSVVTETVIHVGNERFVGRFLTKLEHGLA